MIFNVVKEAASHLHLFSKNGYVGLFWYILDSFLLFLTFIFLKRIVDFNGIEYYALYLFIGISIFHFFRRATTQSLHAVKQKKVPETKKRIVDYFALSSVPVVHVALLHLFELIFIAIIIIYYNLSLLGLLLYVPVLVFLVMVFMCISTILLFLRSYWSNVTQLWMLALKMLFFVTPIFYSTKFLLINQINPVFHMVNIVRLTIIDLNMQISLSSTLIVLMIFLTAKLVKRT